MERIHKMLDTMTLNPGEPPPIYAYSYTPADAEHKYWILLQMSRIPNSSYRVADYGRHIVGILRRLPFEAFGMMFCCWCHMMITRCKVDPDLHFLLLNITCDMLYLPEATLLLEDPLFGTKFHAMLTAAAQKKRRNEELAKEFVNEYALAVARHRGAKREFMNAICEDLIATAMHPDRIERLIEKHGIEVLESI